MAIFGEDERMNLSGFLTTLFGKARQSKNHRIAISEASSTGIFLRSVQS